MFPLQHIQNIRQFKAGLKEVAADRIGLVLPIIVLLKMDWGSDWHCVSASQTGPKEGLKIRGASGNLAGIICPLVEIGLTT